MKQIELIRKLAELDRHGIYVFARRDVEKLFPEEPDKAMEKSLQRMVAEGLLQRVAKGLYLNPAAKSRNRWIAEEVAKALRPGHLSYVIIGNSPTEADPGDMIPPSLSVVLSRPGCLSISGDAYR